VLQKRNDIGSDSISIIYNQKNDSPKYFVLKKSKLLMFVIGMPTITLIALVLGIIGLIHTSPFHLIDTYKQNSLAREAIAKSNSLIKQIKANEEEKLLLSKKLSDAEDQLKTKTFPSESAIERPSQKAVIKTSTAAGPNSLTSLSLFRPIQGQKDQTRPAILTLSDFKVILNRDALNLRFNIIPSGETKLAGHIIVLMKNELTIQVYPPAALNTSDYQINYSSGETFSTQRFRPVDANFLKPRKGGNYIFTVFIFAKNGDLLHNQSTILPVKF
jgi:hypothetical protein